MYPIPRAELFAALLLTLSASAAFSHATLERNQASPNASYRGVVQIHHGCKGQPTTRVSVAIPEGVIGAKPMPKPGWQVATERGPYARAYPYFHGDVSEGVKRITWSGGSLADDQVDEFTFLARITDAFAPGSIVYFPVEQDCASGNHRWTEIPAAGSANPRSPAPGVTIVAGPASSPSAKAADIRVETPWMRATPGGAKVAGGYVRIVNSGAQADRLTGGAVPFAGSVSIHSMSMDGGVMRMVTVEGGLVVKPGETVELKPGGYHLMFEDLKGATPKAGETVEGTLTFERAGTVPVTFTVAPIGASGPDAKPAAKPSAGEHQHHH
jgi:copper(I)-binding protein